MAETKTETKAESKKTTLPEGWELAHEGEGYLVASKLVDSSLGQQRVSESGVDMAALVAKAQAYDDHQAAVAEGRKAEAQPVAQTAEST